MYTEAGALTEHIQSTLSSGQVVEQTKLLRVWAVLAGSGLISDLERITLLCGPEGIGQRVSLGNSLD